MNVRVIAGRFGGRVLDAPGRSSTHAMSERVRNALFNSINAELDGAMVLDAFAGSGCVGIEAISRGASEAVFIEKDRIAAKIINKNLKLLRINETVINTTVSSWLETATSGPVFDIIFADPPYHDPQLGSVMRLERVLKPGGLLVVSHPSGVDVIPIEGISLETTRSYGNANLTLLRKAIG